jgi:hypothetical protein
VRAAAQRYSRKSRGEIRDEQQRQRLDHARRTRMTPQIIIAELAKVHDITLPEDPFERRVEMRRRESLERILARMEGEPVKPRTTRPRGTDLAPVGDFVDVL